MYKKILMFLLVSICGMLFAAEFAEELKQLSPREKVKFWNAKASENFEINNEKVKAYAKNAFHLATKIQDHDGILKSKYNLAVSKFFDADSTLVDDFHAIIKEAELQAKPRLVADCYFALGNFYLNSFSPKALVFYTKSASIRKKNNFTFDLGNSYRFIANYYLLIGNAKKARSFANKAVAIFIKDNRKNQLGFTYGLLAEIHRMTGNNLMSLQYNQKAYFEFQKENYNVGKCHLLINQAEIKTDLNRYKDAEITYFEALDCAKEIDSTYLIGNINLKLAKLFLETQRYDKSLHHIKTAEAIDRNFFVDFTAEILLMYGKIFTAQGNYKKAEKQLKTALEKYKETNQLQGIVQAYHLLGNLYYNHFSDYSKAKSFLKKAYKEAKPLGDKIQADVSKSLYHYYKRTGHIANTLFYFEKYHAHQQTYRSNQNDKALLNLEFKYDNLRLKQEKKIKELESKKMKLELEEQQLQKQLFLLSLIFISFLLLLIAYRFILKKRLLEKVTLEKKTLADNYEELKDQTSELVDKEKINSAKAMAVTTSHELNQPLQIISGNIEMLAMNLEMENKLDDYKKYVNNIAESIERMQSTLQKYDDGKVARFDEYTENTEMALFEEDD